ncbi:unnamed protein product [Cuscuta campestris]|uniref:CCHC-type domain-containing protein n=1 Tax=Cuscuta campestris TaxID=132261 RepID=A0A484M8R7_9ASTE|nr:unnamed protein product [Cuscuta campestris]
MVNTPEESDEEEEVPLEDNSSNTARGENYERGANDFKVDIPTFEGKNDPDDFLEWLKTVERVFDFKDVPEEKNVKIVAMKFRKNSTRMMKISRRCMPNAYLGPMEITQSKMVTSFVKKKEEQVTPFPTALMSTPRVPPSEGTCPRNCDTPSSSQPSSSQMENYDEEFAMMVKQFQKFKKFFKKTDSVRRPSKGKPQVSDSPPESYLCYNCRKPGHWKSACPYPKVEKYGERERNEKKKKAMVAAESDESSSSSSDEEALVCMERRAEKSNHEDRWTMSEDDTLCLMPKDDAEQEVTSQTSCSSSYESIPTSENLFDQFKKMMEDFEEINLKHSSLTEENKLVSEENLKLTEGRKSQLNEITQLKSENESLSKKVKSLSKELGILKSKEAVDKLLETTNHKGRKGLGFDPSSSKRKGRTTFIPPKPTAKPNKQKGKEKEKPTEVPKKEAAKYPGVWYLDSGCSRHMMGDASLLSNLIPYDGPRVTFGGSNDFGLTKGLGNLVYKGLTIQAVSYVEGLNYNLLSISQFCDKGYSLEFCKDMASLKNISTNEEAAKYPGVWYLDSGCSRHMTGDASLLSNLIPYDGPRVTFGGSNDFGLTKGLGNLVYKGLTIQAVSYVEGLNYNLLSISQFCDKGYSLEFCKDMASLKNISTNEVILTRKRIRNIYEVIWDDVKDACLISKVDKPSKHDHEVLDLSDKDEEVNEGDRMKPTEFIPFRSLLLKTHREIRTQIELSLPEILASLPIFRISQTATIPEMATQCQSIRKHQQLLILQIFTQISEKMKVVGANVHFQKLEAKCSSAAFYQSYLEMIAAQELSEFLQMEIRLKFEEEVLEFYRNGEVKTAHSKKDPKRMIQVIKSTVGGTKVKLSQKKLGEKLHLPNSGVEIAIFLVKNLDWNIIGISRQIPSGPAKKANLNNDYKLFLELVIACLECGSGGHADDITQERAFIINALITKSKVNWAAHFFKSISKHLGKHNQKYLCQGLYIGHILESMGAASKGKKYEERYWLYYLSSKGENRAGASATAEESSSDNVPLIHLTKTAKRKHVVSPSPSVEAPQNLALINLEEEEEVSDQGELQRKKKRKINSPSTSGNVNPDELKENEPAEETTAQNRSSQQLEEEVPQAQSLPASSQPQSDVAENKFWQLYYNWRAWKVGNSAEQLLDWDQQLKNEKIIKKCLGLPFNHCCEDMLDDYWLTWKQQQKSFKSPLPALPDEIPELWTKKVQGLIESALASQHASFRQEIEQMEARYTQLIEKSEEKHSADLKEISKSVEKTLEIISLLSKTVSNTMEIYASNSQLQLKEINKVKEQIASVTVGLQKQMSLLQMDIRSALAVASANQVVTKDYLKVIIDNQKEAFKLFRLIGANSGNRKMEVILQQHSPSPIPQLPIAVKEGEVFYIPSHLNMTNLILEAQQSSPENSAQHLSSSGLDGT